MGLYLTTVIALLLASSLVTIASRVQWCKVHPHEINLLKSLLQETEHLDNVNLTDGPSSKSPAIVLDGSSGIDVDNTSLNFLERLHQYSCKRRQIVFRVSVKFDGVADGPILFLSTRSNVVTFSLAVDSDDETIKIGFIHEGETFGISFNYTFSDLSDWHIIIVSFDGRLVTLYVNCVRVGERVIMHPDYCLPDNLKLAIGDNPQNTEVFKGCLQDLVISFRESGIRRLCPGAPTGCEFTATHQLLNETVNALMASNSELEAEVAELKQNLSVMEPMSERYTCFVDGKQYDFEEFFWKENGRLCFCSTGGTARCTVPSSLLKPSIVTTEPPHSERSKQKCSINGEEILADNYQTQEGDGMCTLTKCLVSELLPGIFFAKSGVPEHYKCKDTLKTCSEAAGWTREQKITSRCCGFCTVCEMQTDCPEHAECKEDGDDYTCECKKGFIKDEDNCIDIDECSNGQIDKYGHYCPSDANCINTVGGFVCQCPTGYEFINRGGFTSTCENINECEDDSTCPNNMICNDLPGSHECTCANGTIRAGDHCIPHCDPPCHSEGRCVAHNTCECPGGLNGSYCENDINECLGNHGCSEHATCVNFHGGYFCRCNDGYQGNGRTCADINECDEGTYNCPRSTTCKNTNGSYECECPDGNGDCRGGCVNEKKVYPINGSYLRGSEGCRLCTCINGEWDDCPCQCTENPCCKSCKRESCEVGGCDFEHNEKFTDPTNPYRNCTCKNGKAECTDNDLGFECPPKLISTVKGECPKCDVNECTDTNNGSVVLVNNNCDECTCENKEWICRKKPVVCKPVTCQKTIMMGCCEVCDGSQALTSTTISSFISSQPTLGASISTSISRASGNDDDDDDNEVEYC